MKKLLILVMIAAVGLGAYKVFHKKKNGKINYSRTVASLGSIAETVDTTGEIEPLNRVEINSSVAGRVDKLLVDEGDFVKKGQIVAYLSSTDRVAILDAARMKGESEVKYWEDTYKPTAVICPISGQIILRNVVQGQTITTSTALYAVADDLIVTASVDESDIGKIKVGQSAYTTLDAYPDEKVEGKIFQILYEGQNVSNVITYYVKIRPKSMPPQFKSQMTANIYITVNKKNDVVLVPSVFVTEKTGGYFVLAGDSQKPVEMPVKIGINDGNNTEIISGLQPGTTVYTVSQTYVPQTITGTNPFMPKRPAASSDDNKSSKISSRAASRVMP